MEPAAISLAKMDKAYKGPWLLSQLEQPCKEPVPNSMINTYYTGEKKIISSPPVAGVNTNMPTKSPKSSKDKRMSKLKEFNNRIVKFKKVFELLLSEHIISDIPVKLTEFDYFFAKLEIFLVNRGGLDTIRMLKSVRTIIYTFVAGKPENPGRISTYSDGIPKIFGPVLANHLRTRSTGWIRTLLTLLNVSREIEEWKKPDFSAITAPPTYSQEIKTSYEGNVRLLLTGLKIKDLHSLPIWEDPHFTSKHSPSGMAMLCVQKDLLNLRPEQVQAIEVIGGKPLKLYMDILRDPNYEFRFTIDRAIQLQPKKFKGWKDRTRSLGVVEDVEGKSRVIAMADYWSQDCLIPLHKRLLGDLSRISSDVTFSQDIAPFGDPSQRYWSFDLTSATDRLPIFLYESVVAARFGKKYQEAWTELMIGEPFYLPKSDDKISYATGQPMGLYSSWALLALVHHTIVKWAAHKAKIKNFVDYRLLGDDIVIRNDAVAKEYSQLMTQLGVEISPHKTLVSDDTFEFAKRLFHNGEEVTGFPINGLISATKNSWVEVVNILATGKKRGYPSVRLVTKKSATLALYEIFKVNPGFARINHRNILTQLAVSERNHDLITECYRAWSLPVTCVTDRVGLMHIARSEYLYKLYDDLLRCLNKTLDIFGSVVAEEGKKSETHELVRLPPEVENNEHWSYEPMHRVARLQMVKVQRINLGSPDSGDLNSSFYKDEVENDIERCHKEDLRILDPFDYDGSRSSERKFRMKASSSVKALASMREYITLPWKKKFQRYLVKPYEGPL
jgi:hypothetical protein